MRHGETNNELPSFGPTLTGRSQLQSHVNHRQLNQQCAELTNESS